MKTWKTKSGIKIIRVLGGRSNVFLITNDHKNILIDTSVKRLWPRLLKRLHSLNISKIDYLVLTHAHFDHAANANRIRSKFNASVIIHKNEVEYLITGNSQIPKGTTLITKPLVNILSRLISPEWLRYESCKPDKIIDSDYSLRDIGFNAYLTITPGHTSGSVSLIVDDEVAIVGDTMFGVFRWSAFPPYAEDVTGMIKSWGNLLETRCTEFLPSHGNSNSRRLVQKEFNKRMKAIINSWQY